MRKLVNPFMLRMLNRFFLIVINICLAAGGLYIVDRDMGLSAETAEIREMPGDATLPFRQLTKEEKTNRFLKELQIDTSHLRPGTVSKSIEPWRAYISYYASLYKVDPDLVSAIVYAESKGDPFRISRTGALGLMQIMPSTANYLGFEDVLEPEENISAGVKYIAWLINIYGETHALWAWNAGPSRVKKKHMPGETRKFIVEVLSVKKFLEESRRRGDIS